MSSECELAVRVLQKLLWHSCQYVLASSVTCINNLCTVEVELEVIVVRVHHEELAVLQLLGVNLNLAAYPDVTCVPQSLCVCRVKTESSLALLPLLVVEARLCPSIALWLVEGVSTPPSLLNRHWCQSRDCRLLLTHKAVELTIYAKSTNEWELLLGPVHNL